MPFWDVLCRQPRLLGELEAGEGSWLKSSRGTTMWLSCAFYMYAHLCVCATSPTCEYPHEYMHVRIHVHRHKNIYFLHFPLAVWMYVSRCISLSFFLLWSHWASLMCRLMFFINLVMLSELISWNDFSPFRLLRLLWSVCAIREGLTSASSSETVKFSLSLFVFPSQTGLLSSE